LVEEVFECTFVQWCGECGAPDVLDSFCVGVCWVVLEMKEDTLVRMLVGLSVVLCSGIRWWVMWSAIESCVGLVFCREEERKEVSW
jgi:hypothetical protein